MRKQSAQDKGGQNSPPVDESHQESICVLVISREQKSTSRNFRLFYPQVGNLANKNKFLGISIQNHEKSFFTNTFTRFLNRYKEQMNSICHLKIKVQTLVNNSMLRAKEAKNKPRRCRFVYLQFKNIPSYSLFFFKTTLSSEMQSSKK